MSYFNDWYNNGGAITDDGLSEKLDNTDKILEVAHFVSNLKIYHKFNETIKDKPILLIHACYVKDIEDNVDLRIKDNNSTIETNFNVLL